MRFQAVDEITAAVGRLLSSRGTELVQREKLWRALHKLEAEMRGGSPASRTRVTKLIAEISKIMCEELMRH